ncbi:MAG TPA: cupin domain-containing protein [Rhodanobacteraceae bacterium]|nr:cupin domain-containing protein [Rhodanobacteraceae bacterium]
MSATADGHNGQLAAPAHLVADADLPWVPSGTPGKSSKPLRFMGERGFVEMLRMEPGTVMPLHRHTGEVHVLHLAGERLLSSGERVGPGDYVFEPAGNVDWWKVVGEETLVALVVVMGEVEFLGPGGEVRFTASAATQRTAYEKHCERNGLAVKRLTDV